MAKRYHQTKRDRMHESHGMKHRLGEDVYAGYEDTKKAMKHDAGMIHEDHSAPALLPKNVIQKYWPKGHDYMEGTMSDLFMGVQKQLDEDGKDMRKEFKPGKY